MNSIFKSLRKRAQLLIIAGLSVFTFISFLVSLSTTSTAPANAECYGCCAVTYCGKQCGVGGCWNEIGCDSGEYYCNCGGSEMCCDVGDCQSCTPGCGTGYQESNNGCGTQYFSCTNTYCDGSSCGSSGITCFRYKYTVTVVPNSGSCTQGTADWCGNTANTTPGCTRSGYTLSSYSLTGTCGGSFSTSTGVCSSVTQAITVTANWVASNQAPTSPTAPYCEGSANPTGVTDTTPEFSAVFQDPDTGDTGNWYEIEVYYTPNIVWNSTLTAMTPTAIGSRSPDISYAGSSLTFNRRTYWWKIRFADDDGLVGEWSNPLGYSNYFVTDGPSTSNFFIKGLKLKGLGID